jgi:hypothetical protein
MSVADRYRVHMDLIGPAIGAVSGLFGDAVGGVLTAGGIARASDHSHDQVDAERRVLALVRGYRAKLQWDAAQLPKIDRYPDSYGSLSGQERVAMQFIRELPLLRPRIARRIEPHLQPLFGTLVLTLARQRAFVDDVEFHPDAEIYRQSATAHRILAQDPNADGALQELLSDQNDRVRTEQGHAKVIGFLDAIRDVLVPRRSRATLREEDARADAALRSPIA